MINVIGGPTQINPQQMRLSTLFSVERILASRGFQTQSEGTAIDTLLARESWTRFEHDLMFTVFDDATLRSDLLSAVDNHLFSPSSDEVTHLLDLPDFRRDRNRFSTTFEWYVGELLVRKFQAFSSSFAVEVKNIVRNTDNGTAGDFDVLSILGDMNLLYLECKTGRCTQKSIKNTVERSLALHSLAAVIFMGKGTDVAALMQQLKGLQHPIYKGMDYIAKLNIKSLPDSSTYSWYDCYFVPADQTSGTVEVKLRAVMRLLAAQRSAVLGCMRPDASEYVSLGYDYAQIKL